MDNPFVVTSVRSMRPYARRVVECLRKEREFADSQYDIDYTEALDAKTFADGEMEVELGKSVRGRNVVLFCNSSRNDAGISLSECKQELYHAIDVLQRSQAKKIIVFEPYVSCSRSDRTTRRNSVGFWVHYKTLISLGMDHFITYQLHSDKSKTAVDPVLCDIDDIPATKLLKRYLCDQYIGTLDTLHTEVQENWMFCSVDAGGEKLAKQFASAFNTQLVIAHKQRNYAKANTVESINILSAVPVEGKTLWIVDDMIDTGGSLCGLIRELAKMNPKEINAAVVHPVFSGKAIEALASLKNEGLLNHLVVCDTVSCEGLKEALPGIEIVSSARFSSHVIRVIAFNQQMSRLTAPFAPSEYLQKPRLFGFAVGEEEE